MKMRIQPSRLHGTLPAAPSKSMGHRMMIGATLAGNSRVDNLGGSVDMDATFQSLKALGWEDIERSFHSFRSGDAARVEQKQRIVDCVESGSTLRILLPLALDGVPTEFHGASRLLQRNMEPYRILCSERNFHWQQNDDKIEVCGTLKAGDFSMRGDISSQFISGLLFALPTLGGDSSITLTGKLESRAYIDLTLEAMSQFGVMAFWEEENVLSIPGKQRYQSAEVRVEGDYSHAAFFLVAAAIGQREGITLEGLSMESKQGDRAIVEILAQMGAVVDRDDERITVTPGQLIGADIDAAQIPDLVPILAVAGCAAQGNTNIYNAGRLRDKESDRLAAITAELRKLGACITEKPDGLEIVGGQALFGTDLQAYNDHRIAMSLAIASALCQGEVVLEDAQSVNKSAPQFWKEFQSLGGHCETTE